MMQVLKVVLRFSGGILLILALYSTSALAQVQVKQLQRLDSLYHQRQSEAEFRMSKYITKRRSAREIKRIDGSIMLMVDVSPSGIPIYVKSDNIEVASSLGVNELYSGGTLGLNLQGEGMQIGIWDEGKVRNDHVELAGRVTQMDNPGPTFNTHATHVLGTLMASGVNANAAGMSPKATAIAYDFNGDVSEMISQAAPDQTSIILSNHSYGTLSGWDNDGGTWTWHGDPSISNVRDWKFGFYNSTSSFYDGIAFNAPYYLIIKSAGNDNTDVGDGSRPPDCDPFDCIPTNGVAKNILTVGAVKKLTGPYTGPSDVELTSFTSFGPADDGRIKPDLVTPGQAVFSSAANTSSSYSILSGTSMSAPAATGVLALLQELHKDLNGGNLMKAATLKALAIHTAREAGSAPGPDYRFGWGLLDAEAAAKVIVDKDDQNVFIEEATLDNNTVFEMELTPKENTKIIATLVWNDPAGIVLPPSLNPTIKMLVNDLDLVLVDDGGTTQFPWKLNPSNPSAAAIKGSNNLDNVEKLEFSDPEPRNYKLRVSHKGSLLNDMQNFSLIVTYSSVIDPRTTYYWIGNSGDWMDGSHWSLTSGGSAANETPSSDDNVVFDENSFSTDNQTVSLTADESCFSLRWFANNEVNLSFNNHNLTVNGGVNLMSDKINTSTPGTMRLVGTAGSMINANLNDNSLGDLSLEFSGDASWLLSGNFKVNEIEIQEGEVSFGDDEVHLSALRGVGSLQKLVNLTNTTLSGETNLDIDFSNLDLAGNDAVIRIPIGLTTQINLGDNIFNGTLDLEGGNLTVSGSGEIQRVEGFGSLYIEGNIRWNDFLVQGGSNIIFQESSQQHFVNNFSLLSTEANRISIASSSTTMASLEFEKHQKICLDYLDIQHLAVSGQALVSVGLHSTLDNAAGWIADDCDNILFADFDVEYTCEQASVYFVDKSSGPVNNRSWNFGDDNSGNNESDKLNPIHYYEAAGEYLVSLQVSDGENTDIYTHSIQLTENVLEDNSIELSNGKLISFLPAEKYQWVLDGDLLDDTNLRSIDFSNGYGEYSVLIFDDVCNKRSSPFLVTDLYDKESISISVFPNPANEIIIISALVNFVEEIRLLNSLGQVVPVSISEEEDKYTIHVDQLPKGVYFLRMLQRGNASFERIVIR